MERSFNGFTGYMNEANASGIDKIIKERKTIIKNLGKLTKYVAKDDQKIFKKSIKLLDTNLLESIKKYQSLGENKILQKNISGLIKSMEHQLMLPHQGNEIEKILKEDYYNVCDAMAGVVFAKLDPKLIIKESSVQNESRAGVIGALGGGMFGMLLGGPLGAALGAALGGSTAEANSDTIDSGIDAIMSIDPEEALMTAGIGLGTFAGILTGTLPVAIAGGVVGGVISSILYDEVATKGKVLSRVGKSIRNTSSKTKKFTIKMYNKILDNSIYIQRRRMSKALKAQWKLRTV